MLHTQRGQCAHCGMPNQIIAHCEYCPNWVCCMCMEPTTIPQQVVCRDCQPYTKTVHYLQSHYALIDARRFFSDCDDVWRDVASIFGAKSHRIYALDSIIDTHNTHRPMLAYHVDVKINTIALEHVMIEMHLTFPSLIHQGGIREVALVHQSVPHITIYGLNGVDTERRYTKPIRIDGSSTPNQIHTTIVSLQTMEASVGGAGFEGLLARL